MRDQTNIATFKCRTRLDLIQAQMVLVKFVSNMKSKTIAGVFGMPWATSILGVRWHGDFQTRWRVRGLPSNSNSLPIKSRQVSRWLNSAWRSIPIGWSGWSGLNRGTSSFPKWFQGRFCFVELCAVLTLRIFGSCDLGENMGNNLEITLEPSRKLQTSDFVACMGHAS